MTKIVKIKTSKKDSLIDDEVIASSKNEKSWDEEITVVPGTKPTSIRLSPKTINRAKFFARIHHERGYQSWLKKIVEERIDTEYELYKKIKNEAGNLDL